MKSKEFAAKLLVLMDEYDAEFSYTINDDGVHLRIPGEHDITFFDREDLKEKIS